MERGEGGGVLCELPLWSGNDTIPVVDTRLSRWRVCMSECAMTEGLCLQPSTVHQQSMTAIMTVDAVV